MYYFYININYLSIYLEYGWLARMSSGSDIFLIECDNHMILLFKDCLWTKTANKGQPGYAFKFVLEPF